MDGSRVAARFRESRVEAATPEPTPASEAVVSRLAVAGASPADGAPKYQQALGHAHRHRRIAVVPELGPDASVVEVVRAAVAASVVQLLRHDAGVHLGDDLEDVIQTRVATRRLPLGPADVQSAPPGMGRGREGGPGGSAPSSAPSRTSTCSSSA